MLKSRTDRLNMTARTEKNNSLDLWYVYIIKTKLNTLYTGVTRDVERRFSEHQSGGTKAARYLKGKAPLELVWYESVLNKRLAMQLEYRIKKLPRAKKDELVSRKCVLEMEFSALYATFDDINA